MILSTALYTDFIYSRHIAVHGLPFPTTRERWGRCLSYGIKNRVDLGSHFRGNCFKKLKRRNGLVRIVVGRTLEKVNEPRSTAMFGTGYD